MPADEPNRWWRAGFAVVSPLARALFQVRWEGADRIPSRDAAVLAFGHVSVLDGPVLAIEVMARAQRQTRFLVASEVFDTRIMGPILRRYEQIPIRRGRGDDDALEEAIRALRAGAVLAMAPEGRVSERPDEGLQRVRTGAARITLAAGVPLLPVGIWGTQARWGYRGIRLGPPIRPVVAISIGEPLMPAGDVGDAQQVGAFTHRIAERLERQMGLAKELASGAAPLRSGEEPFPRRGRRV
jgi:1-acyl-sn-glycerol-3-phosphate acyltransferase